MVVASSLVFVVVVSSTCVADCPLSFDGASVIAISASRSATREPRWSPSCPVVAVRPAVVPPVCWC
ncbi:hypothetical protein PF005_g14960 [Phytophthora fragariae]|uniref:RxLR effector protein n=1 Tax=Phytophthora fragariae TaxID=53985 RepID=A0A6A3XG46_9STRA|nr:hypothetical protein PF005_g14960 [Phytophthora fragariae]